ncbi:hypothetical protein [Alkaliphilus sp. B6464]|uniref:hypothetical protein n=1 Tax=Alkaliphilus sp. B6464 TaxID=2731219 RepID=UPI001BA8A885|nr:hypothetical protein [Alkaliphilus sp. B6464]QUH21829.1 hypothetical protein HYG84_17995 [Alkaliphilus sp. B6464]
MSIPRSIKSIKGEEVLQKWCSRIKEFDEDAPLFINGMVAHKIAKELDNPKKLYITSISIEWFEEDGCIFVKGGNDTFGYIIKKGEEIIPRLREGNEIFSQKKAPCEKDSCEKCEDYPCFTHFGPQI